MSDTEILKSTRLKHFMHCYDKGYSLTQSKKVLLSANTIIPTLDLGALNFKGQFSLFKYSECFISTHLAIDHTNPNNTLNIKYNLLKNSMYMNILFPKHTAFIRTLQYQLACDKYNSKLTLNRLMLLFKNNFKVTCNADTSERFVHVGYNYNNICRCKYKYNHKGKNTMNLSVNKQIGNVWSYFNNIEIAVKGNTQLKRNIQGVIMVTTLSPTLTMNAFTGCDIANCGKSVVGLYVKHNVNNAVKVENCVVVNYNKERKDMAACAVGVSYKNWANWKVKVARDEVKMVVGVNLRNMSAFVNYNYNCGGSNNNSGGNGGNNSKHKYSIGINFKW